MPAVCVHADHLFTGEGPGLRDGAVVLVDGLVVDVGSAGDVRRRHAGANVIRIDGVVTPGLVNAHTHVELSALAGKVPGGRGFVAWVDALVGLRAELDSEAEATAIDDAVAALRRSGTIAVGDVTNTLAAVGPLARAGIGGSVFHEVFGIARDAVLARLARLDADRDERHPRWPTDDLAYVPAPHTLYTTHPDAVRALLERARREGKRTTLHFAEHAAERRALEAGEGPVVRWLAERTRHEREWPRRSLIDVAKDLGVLAPDVLLVHLTDLTPREIEAVAAARSPIVLCPRSNAHIEGRTPDLPTMRRAGIAPALGTDSLASSGSLDVLEEAALLHRLYPDIPAFELLQMATSNGARALGRPDLGSLSKGARPGVVAFDDLPAHDDPAAAILDDTARARRLVVGRTRTEELPS